MAILLWTALSARWSCDIDNRMALAHVMAVTLGVAVYASASLGNRTLHAVAVVLCLLVSVRPMAANGNLASEFLAAWCVYLGGWPGLAIGLVALPACCLRALLCLRMTLPRWQVPVAMMAAIGVLLSFIALPPAYWRQKAVGRLEIWRAAVLAVGEWPLTGHGAGAQPLAVLLHLGDGYYAVWPDGRQPKHVQNDPLEIAVTTGLVGVALWAGLLLSHRVWRRPGACAVLFMGLLGFPLAIPATAAVLWTDLGELAWHERWQGISNRAR